MLRMRCKNLNKARSNNFQKFPYQNFFEIIFFVFLLLILTMARQMVNLRAI